MNKGIYLLLMFLFAILFLFMMLIIYMRLSSYIWDSRKTTRILSLIGATKNMAYASFIRQGLENAGCTDTAGGQHFAGECNDCINRHGTSFFHYTCPYLSYMRYYDGFSFCFAGVPSVKETAKKLQVEIRRNQDEPDRNKEFDQKVYTGQ